MTPTKKADAPNRAMTVLFHGKGHRSGVGDLRRWAA
jgi:hypothetical protein